MILNAEFIPINEHDFILVNCDNNAVLCIVAELDLNCTIINRWDEFIWDYRLWDTRPLSEQINEITGV